jgi:hypothetical protein
MGFAGTTADNPEPEGIDDLKKVKGGLFKQCLVQPDAIFSDYGKLLTYRVRLQFNIQQARAARAGTGSMISAREEPPVTISGADQAEVARVIDEAFALELGSGEAFSLVHEAGPATLLVVTSVEDIDLRGAPSSSGRSQPLLSRGTVQFDLIDSETGVILARFGERSKIPHTGESDGPWSDVGEWARLAAADLLQELKNL